MKEIFETDLRGSHGSSIKSILSISLEEKDFSQEYDDGGVVQHWIFEVEFHNGRKEKLEFNRSFGGLVGERIYSTSHREKICRRKK